jgi:ribonuclease P protein subunit RPR2
MAKMKADGSKKVSHPHLYARLSFLHQAAQLLESQELSKAEAATQEHEPVTQQHEGIDFEAKSNAIARELSYHSSAITRKSKLRIEASIKRTICKRCSSKLIEGQTSFSRIENKSRGGLKSWADVLVVTCLSCQMEKRFSIGQARGQKKVDRKTQTTSELAGQNEVDS